MSDERPDSLAAQAAAWVPPWERATRPPDAAYAAEQRARAEEADDEELSEAGLSDDDDDFDPAFEGPNPVTAPADPPAPAPPGEHDGAAGPAASASPAAESVPELPPVPGEVQGPISVDAPLELPGDEDRAPTDVGIGPDLPVPDAIEVAEEHEDEPSTVVDAPLPPDGDDAGDVFDQAADDDVSNDDEVDLPFVEEVPGPEADEEPAGAATPDPADSLAVDSPAVDSPASDSLSAASPAPDGDDAAAARPSSGVPAQSRRRKGRGAAAAVVEVAPVATAGASPRTDDGIFAETPELKPLDDQELRAALEAIMLVVDEPVAEMQLAQILEQPTERVAAMLDDISARYTAAGHGFDLRRVAGGWRLYTRPEYAPYVERFVLDGQSVRLTQAALETLAVVAYKQPVTRSRISAIRGVNCDGVMRTLVTRGLIEECGTESETGAHLYRTTSLFLEKLGLNSVDQLPPLAPFLPDDVEEVLDASG